MLFLKIQIFFTRLNFAIHTLKLTFREGDAGKQSWLTLVFTFDLLLLVICVYW